MQKIGGNYRRNIVILIIIFLIALAGYYFRSLGEEISLKVTELVPRHDNGDYLMLKYAISDLDPSNFAYDPVFNGEECYVPLVKKGKYWEVKPGIIKNKDQMESGIIYIKGKIVRGGFELGQNVMPADREIGRVIRMNYGIEEFNLSKGIDESLDYGEKEISAGVKIGKNLQVRLLKLTLEGQDWLK
jgi:uncharacterized membrane-anchored protein